MINVRSSRLSVSDCDCNTPYKSFQEVPDFSIWESNLRRIVHRLIYNIYMLLLMMPKYKTLLTYYIQLNSNKQIFHMKCICRGISVYLVDVILDDWVSDYIYVYINIFFYSQYVFIAWIYRIEFYVRVCVYVCANSALKKCIFMFGCIA